ncbi:transposable element Tcb1 transposase [Trichonephila clavipes]|nr:transposable element Tcb1 transposase [Trichonephila clavipes]
MDWPARSPDLNPIEHVWGFLGRRLAARALPPVTIRELRLALQDEWAAMPQQLTDTLILSMGKRCETCLAVVTWTDPRYGACASASPEDSAFTSRRERSYGVRVFYSISLKEQGNSSGAMDIYCRKIMLKIKDEVLKYILINPKGLPIFYVFRHNYQCLEYNLHAEVVEVEIEIVSPSIVPSGNFAELNRTVTCMVLKANDRRTSCPCHDEFRGPRSDYVRQVASENNNNNYSIAASNAENALVFDGPLLLPLLSSSSSISSIDRNGFFVHGFRHHLAFEIHSLLHLMSSRCIHHILEILELIGKSRNSPPLGHH